MSEGKSIWVRKCKIHPRYKAMREPNCKKAGCSCRAIWQAKQARIAAGWLKLLKAINDIEV